MIVNWIRRLRDWWAAPPPEDLCGMSEHLDRLLAKAERWEREVEESRRARGFPPNYRADEPPPSVAEQPERFDLEAARAAPRQARSTLPR